MQLNHEHMPAKFVYALYSDKQARVQKFMYTGLTTEGKPFHATEFIEKLRKSYWDDGIFVGKVQKWYKASLNK
ncbi:hypothetical protein N9A45_00060 [bacterium]|nr:hypothetical protein [bacterium]